MAAVEHASAGDRAAVDPAAQATSAVEVAPTVPDAELDFWSFVDVAVGRAQDTGVALDPDAMRVVIGLHRVASMIVYDLESSVHRPSGWSWAGFRLLFTLWVAGPLDASATAHLSGMSRPAVSALVRTLERDGLVRRTPSEQDRRAVRLALTDAGRQALTRAFAAHHEREQLWASALTKDERVQLFALLTKLSAGTQARRIRRRI